MSSLLLLSLGKSDYMFLLLPTVLFYQGVKQRLLRYGNISHI
jgi:hypothetical protein